MARAILLAEPWALQFALETPDGDIVTDALASRCRTAGGTGLQMPSRPPLPIGAGEAPVAGVLAPGRGGIGLKAVSTGSVGRCPPA